MSFACRKCDTLQLLRALEEALVLAPNPRQFVLESLDTVATLCERLTLALGCYVLCDSGFERSDALGCRSSIKVGAQLRLARAQGRALSLKVGALPSPLAALLLARQTQFSHQARLALHLLLRLARSLAPLCDRGRLGRAFECLERPLERLCLPARLAFTRNGARALRLPELALRPQRGKLLVVSGALRRQLC